MPLCNPKVGPQVVRAGTGETASGAVPSAHRADAGRTGAGGTACPLRARSDGEPGGFTVTHGQRKHAADLQTRSSEPPDPLPSKLVMRVRFPSPAPQVAQYFSNAFEALG